LTQTEPPEPPLFVANWQSEMVTTSAPSNETAPPGPLPVFAVSGYALSFAFSPTPPFADDNGGWAAAGVVLAAGIWYGLIATAAAAALLAIRGAVYSVEYFG